MKNIDVIDSFISTGIMRAEIDKFLSIELQEEGYSKMDIQPYRIPVLITITVVNPAEVLGERKARLNSIKELLMMRFPQLAVGLEIVVEMVKERNLCPKYQADYIRSKFLENIPYRRSVNAVLKSVMSAGALGCTVIVSGKLKGQRAKSAKSSQGLMIHTGGAKDQFVKEALSIAHLKQGVMGIKVRIMLPQDQEGIKGPVNPLPDKITILEPQEL